MSLRFLFVDGFDAARLLDHILTKADLDST